MEDDASVRSAIAFALGIAGHPVKAFASAEAALASSVPAASECLVIDYRLPGLNGVALLEQFRASGVITPAIFITSNPSAQLIAQIKATSSSLVEKPLLRNCLADAIANAIASSLDA